MFFGDLGDLHTSGTPHTGPCDMRILRVLRCQRHRNRKQLSRAPSAFHYHLHILLVSDERVCRSGDQIHVHCRLEWVFYYNMVTVNVLFVGFDSFVLCLLQAASRTRSCTSKRLARTHSTQPPVWVSFQPMQHISAERLVLFATEQCCRCSTTWSGEKKFDIFPSSLGSFLIIFFLL